MRGLLACAVGSVGTIGARRKPGFARPRTNARVSLTQPALRVLLFADVPAQQIARQRIVEALSHLLLDLGKGVLIDLVSRTANLVEVADLRIGITRNALCRTRVNLLTQFIAK